MESCLPSGKNFAVTNLFLDAKEKFVKEYEEEQVHQFLLGLDESRFSNVCTNIIGMESLPDIDSVYQRVVREERRLNSASNDSNQEVVGFMTTTDQGVRSYVTGGDIPTDGGVVAAVARRDRSVVCSHCGRTGHEKECWQIIGFPEWWTEKKSSWTWCWCRTRKRIVSE